MAIKRPPAGKPKADAPEATTAILWATVIRLEATVARLEAGNKALDDRVRDLEDKLYRPAGQIITTEELLLDRCFRGDVWMTGDGRIMEATAAWLLGWRTDSLRNARREGGGPTFYKLGGHGSKVTYRIRDIALWLDSRREH